MFQGWYKAVLVDNGSDAYFPIVSSYIHLNPARAGWFDLKKSSLSDFSWSSYPFYLSASKRPVWLCVDRVLNCHSVEDTRKGRAWYRQYIQKSNRETPYLFLAFLWFSPWSFRFE